MMHFFIIQKGAKEGTRCLPDGNELVTRVECCSRFSLTASAAATTFCIINVQVS